MNYGEMRKQVQSANAIPRLGDDSWLLQIIWMQESVHGVARGVESTSKYDEVPDCNIHDDVRKWNHSAYIVVYIYTESLSHHLIVKDDIVACATFNSPRARNYE